MRPVPFTHILFFFFFNYTATTEIYTLSLHDALPIFVAGGARVSGFPTQLYYEPTVLDRVSEEMEVARDQTFGPVVPIRTIRSEDGALATIEESRTGSWRPCSRATSLGGFASRKPRGPGGSMSTRLRTTGRRISPSAAAPARAAGSAALAAASPSTASPS